MLYSCTHMATVGFKGLKSRLKNFSMCMSDKLQAVCSQSPRSTQPSIPPG